MGTANIHAQSWGARARDWAEVQEGMLALLYDVLLHTTKIGADTKLLDIGCGSGMFCQLAAQRGAHVSGLDASEPLLTIARERVPQGDFRMGDMEGLPYSNQTFDVVTGINSFQFAASPVNALQEARRVARTGAPVIIVVWGKRDDNESATYMAAVGSLLPPPPPGTPGPFALSSDGVLEALIRQVGMTPELFGEVDCPWEYPDEKTALRGLLSSGPAVRAIQSTGEEAVREAVTRALASFKTTSGGYRLRNKFRYLIART